MAGPSLATSLGTTTHLSPLLRKIGKLGLDERGLERLAIQRGCDYYDDGGASTPQPMPHHVLSNEELAIALLHSGLSYSPQRIRLGAAMLGAFGNNPVDIAYLTRLERCEALVSYVAKAGSRFEPDNPFWTKILALLPPTAPPKSSVVPHPTRFVAMTGVTRRGIETVAEWIRPSKPVALHG